MKKIALLLYTILVVLTLKAQDVMRMEDGVSATFKLKEVSMVQVEGVRHSDLLGTGQKYFVKLKFGKRKFDLELFDTISDKLVWATYSLPNGAYFQKNKVKSDDHKEVYGMIIRLDGKETSYEVEFLKGANLRVTVDYSEKKEGSKTLDRAIVASGKL